MSATLKLVHVELATANAFITRWHRHHGRVQGHRFSIGAKLDGRLVGIAVIGRPLGGQRQDRWAEVTRLCSDGTPNVCSFLYGAAARAAFALGFTRIQTYIMKDESGASLKAAGWSFDRMSLASGWHKRGRPLADHLNGRKQLWFRGENSPDKPPNGAWPRRQWERVGMSRSTWYRRGKPKTPPLRVTQRQAASELRISLRTYQCHLAEMRVS